MTDTSWFLAINIQSRVRCPWALKSSNEKAELHTVLGGHASRLRQQKAAQNSFFGDRFDLYLEPDKRLWLVLREPECFEFTCSETGRQITQPTSHKSNSLHAPRLAGRLHNLHHTSPTVYMIWHFFFFLHMRLRPRAQISVCKTPCLSTGSTMALTSAETVQERPLLSWYGETRHMGILIFAHFLHILASPGYAPGTIAVNVTRFERGYNACKTPRCI